MIRQAISCDICGAEKKQTNHWFVAYDQGGELRLSGFNSRNRLRPGTRHLCGQTCLHKLVDEFLARALSGRAPQAAASEATDELQNEVLQPAAYTDASLTSVAAYKDFESSTRLIPTPASGSSLRAPLRMPMELVAQPAKPRAEEAVALVDEPPRYASRNWRAAAWEREREREQRTGKGHSGIATHRRVGT